MLHHSFYMQIIFVIFQQSQFLKKMEEMLHQFNHQLFQNLQLSYPDKNKGDHISLCSHKIVTFMQFNTSLYFYRVQTISYIIILITQ